MEGDRVSEFFYHVGITIIECTSYDSDKLIL